MKYPESPINILGTIIEAISAPEIIIESVDVTGNIVTLNCEDIFYAEPMAKITIAGKEYTIKDTVKSCAIIIETTDTIDAASFNLYPVYFYYGTPRATETERAQIRKAKLKTPFVWLPLIFRQKNYPDPENIDDRIMYVKPCFLTQANYEKWLTPDSYHNAIEPMTRLVWWFVRYMQAHPGRFNMDDFTFETTDYPKFGVYSQNAGIVSSLFTDKLAGVELNMNLPVLKTFNCCPHCGVSVEEQLIVFEDGDLSCCE